ncbi:hypothetical protein [Pseudomonas antarctica]|uniref:hypothetical protein n=1 Tax=Pseudomonas antarctica TaxID=219572 RepID=UPI0012E988A4|nr:hypothetical protein [Pseudomonas antarctica]
MNVQALAQTEFDNRLPPPVSESALEIARQEWIYNAVETLVDRRSNVQFKRRLQAPQGVTFKTFATEVEHDERDLRQVRTRRCPKKGSAAPEGQPGRT